MFLITELRTKRDNGFLIPIAMQSSSYKTIVPFAWESYLSNQDFDSAVMTVYDTENKRTYTEISLKELYNLCPDIKNVLGLNIKPSKDSLTIRRYNKEIWQLMDYIDEVVTIETNMKEHVLPTREILAKAGYPIEENLTSGRCLINGKVSGTFGVYFYLFYRDKYGLDWVKSGRGIMGDLKVHNDSPDLVDIYSAVLDFEKEWDFEQYFIIDKTGKVHKLEFNKDVFKLFTKRKVLK
jgi:hypothetical protein